jgi:hypothetical protein
MSSSLNHVEIRDDLTIAIGDAAARLSPSEGFRIAEDLIRKSARRALAEEAASDLSAGEARQ